MTRLSAATLGRLAKEVAPAYVPAEHGIGIRHLGRGAFHRSHQAAYTDAALARQGGDWRIAAVSLRSTGTVDALAPQDNLFTLIESGADGLHPRVIGSLGRTIAAARTPEAVLDVFADPAIRIVTLTVTEKAYGFDRANRDCDPEHADVAADLADPRAPRGVLGILTEGVRRRRDAGHPAPAILCCDNLPENGRLLRAGVIGFARRVDPDLADWIEAHVAFPSSMVDRITPAATAETLARAHGLTGLEDAAAIETEPFAQWVIEDEFPQGRPAWEAAGAIFVPDVTPYEKMKLRMLNGAHSLIAYASVVAGHEYVRDAMADPALAALADRQMRAVARTLGPLRDIDLDTYRADLLARFANPGIAHQTRQIAMDGTEKLPQRIFEPAVEALKAGDDPAPYAFATAAWMRYCLGKDDTGAEYPLNDPRAGALQDAARRAGYGAGDLRQTLMAVPGLFPETLRESVFRAAVTERLASVLSIGMAAAIRNEARDPASGPG
ncbi:MAG: mannitol dehydrogenase family protein [Rhodobacteraceae bacterium]|nr:mannitol dehydrogenase family protein [Paracoccaceae bacterium]